MRSHCLIIGYNDSSFPAYVEMVRSMGADGGAYRDLALAFVEHEAVPMRSMDFVNLFREPSAQGGKPLHNCDFLWPTITYLGTYLKRRGFEFDFVNLPHLEKDVLQRKLTENDPMTVAITTTLYVSPYPILELVEAIRACNPRTKILVGGPYIYNQSRMLDTEKMNELFRLIGADIFVVSRDGELTLVNLLQALSAGSDISSVHNIAWRNGSGYTLNESSLEENSVEEMCIDYSLFGREALGEFVSLSTARSCPFSCAFCGFPERAGEYRLLALDAVERQLDTLREMGVTTLTFLDDTFNVPKARFRKLLQLLIDKKYGFHWNSFYRSDHGNEETIAMMAESGCEGVFLGVESGSDTMLKAMNKSSRRKNYMEAIPLFRKYGVSTHANFIIGFPGETQETVAETIDLIRTARPDFYRAQLWYADPITPVWRRRLELRIKGSAFQWSHATMDAKTAIDIVDRLFLCIDESVWLPQNGFEQWSTFYLQRKGMSLERIKAFLRFFNAAVKDKLLYPSRAAIPAQLLDGMRSAVRGVEPAASARECLELYSAAHYNAAESELVAARAASGGMLAALRAPEHAGDGAWAVATQLLEKSALVEALRASGWNMEDVYGGLLLALVSRLSGREDVAVVVDSDVLGVALPLRLDLRWDESLRELIETFARARALAQPRRLFGLPLAQNRARLEMLGATPIEIEVGYTSGPALELVRRLEQAPGKATALNLVLSAVEHDGRCTLSVAYRRGIGALTADAVLKHAARLFGLPSEQMDVPFEQVALDESVAAELAENDSNEAFFFAE